MVFKIIPNISINENVYHFCKDYVKNNLYDRGYDNNNFLEYYPSIDFFETNFNIESICIGQIVTGTVTTHIDIDRESTLIIPIQPTYISITIDNELIYCDSSFLLDTTKPHGAKSIKNSIFLAIDFKKNFIDSLEYIRNNLELTIGICT